MLKFQVSLVVMASAGAVGTGEPSMLVNRWGLNREQNVELAQTRRDRRDARPGGIDDRVGHDGFCGGCDTWHCERYVF